MPKSILLLSFLLIAGCSSDSDNTVETTKSAAAPSSDKCTMVTVNEDRNLDLVLECDGHQISGSGVFVFSKTVRGKKMVTLKYTNSRGKESYLDGILKNSSTSPELVHEKKYTLSCTLNQAINEDCTIKPAE